jgi:threonine synthase
MAYYAWASLEYRARNGAEPGFVVPSGNLGNAAAASWARRCGLPVREVVLATNANPAVTAFFGGTPWTPHPTLATLATAMDVGSASNMERLLHLFGGEAGTRAALRAFLVDDDEIRRVIRDGPAAWGEVWDPHTAVAVAARERLETPHWIVVSTAHPAKFEGVVEPLIGRAVPVPPDLARLLDRPGHAEEIEPELEAFRVALGSGV